MSHLFINDTDCFRAVDASTSLVLRFMNLGFIFGLFSKAENLRKTMSII